MALNGILSIDLAVKNPDELSEFWQRRGLTADASATLGTADRNKQITVVEDDYRHLAALHLSCETEQDLANIAKRLHDMGVDSIISGTTLTCKDPIVDHAISVEVGAPAPLTPSPDRSLNSSGKINRDGTRAEAITELKPRPPRRLGHVVIGTPHFEKVIGIAMMKRR